MSLEGIANQLVVFGVGCLRAVRSEEEALTLSKLRTSVARGPGESFPEAVTRGRLDLT